MLNVVTWFWGTKYRKEDVHRLAIAVRRNLRQEHRFTVCQPGPEDEHLTTIKGCFARLRIFDPQWQHANGLKGRIVCIDLDVVVTGELDPLFERDDPFSILLNANSSNPCVYNGSIFSFIAGYRPDIWSDFSLEAASKAPYDSFPDDQGWLAHVLPGATGWNCGSESGIWSFRKRTWPKDDKLPEGARLVVFPGWRDPSKFTHLPWVKQYWSTVR